METDFDVDVFMRALAYFEARSKELAERSAEVVLLQIENAQLRSALGMEAEC